jgi:hypothetical protein
LIPLLVHQYDLSPQAAMGYVTELVRETYAKFGAAECRLFLPTDDAKLDQDVRRFVQGYKDIATGNVH